MNDDYYCEFKKECIKDNCDCMYEEWHKMSEQNVILCNKINKAIDYIEHLEWIEMSFDILGKERIRGTQKDFVNDLLDILKGSDSNE